MRLELRSWALPAIAILNAVFSVHEQNWSAALGWSVAAAGWWFYATHREYR